MSACAECDSNGMRMVTEHFVDSVAPPWPEAPTLDADPEVQQAYEHAVVGVAAKRAAAANTVYPCKACNPRAFWRWVGGCYSPDHDAAGCKLCLEAGQPRHRRSDPKGYRASHDSPPPERDTKPAMDTF